MLGNDVRHMQPCPPAAQILYIILMTQLDVSAVVCHLLISTFLAPRRPCKASQLHRPLLVLVPLRILKHAVTLINKSGN
jgi:hypothetical protein